jgi:segregation and condensation protein A
MPEPIEIEESEIEAPVVEPETAIAPEAVEEIAAEPVEVKEFEIEAPVVEPETETAPEAIEDATPEPIETEEPELTVETTNEATFEPEPANTPISASEPAPELLEEPEPIVAAKPEAATDPAVPPAVERTALALESSLAAEAEPVPEPVTGAAAVRPLVLTTQPTAEEEASAKADEKAAAKLAARQKKLDESSEQSPFSVIVGQVYDGPLDLLLDLIRKQDIDIYDIPIAKITAQFLAYVNQLKASDVDVAGEFIYIASLLIHIKSKMLLPRETTGPEDTAEDPRRELVERLLEHERFKSAAQMLQQKQMLEAATWSNPGAREFKDDEAAEPEIAADTVDLVRIFRDILERARKRPAFDVNEDSVTVGQMIQFLARRLTIEDKPVALRRLLSHTRSERALIAMFLALLELVRLQAILLRQDRQFSEIFIKKHTGFDSVMNDGLANARDDWR